MESTIMRLGRVPARRPLRSSRTPMWLYARLESLEERLPLASQADSITDRVVDSVGYDAFKGATSLPAISPALSQATASDLIVSYSSMQDPLASTVTAVVLKPRAGSLVYQIPVPGVGVNHYDFLHAHLQQAVQQQAGTILFPPSFTFLLRPPIPFADQPSGPLEQAAHLNFTGMNDVVIDFHGSTIDLLDKVVGIRVEDSHRITIKNGTIRGEGLLSSVAQVRADTTTAGIKLDVLPEFESALGTAWSGAPPLRTVGSAELGPDNRWRLDAVGYAELFTNRGLPHNNFAYADGEYRATSPLINGSSPFAVNDYVWLLHENNSAHALYLDNEDGSGLEDISLENLTFENVPGMVIVGEVDRGLHVNDVAIIVSEESDGIWGASSDGIHINANGGDVVIENSDLGPNGDDKITVKGNYWKVTAVNTSTKTLTVQPVENGVSMSRWGRAGDRVVFITDTFQVEGQATLAADSVRPGDVGSLHTIQLQSIPSGVGVNSLVGNVDRSGGRVIVRNNHLHESRSQGILVQTSHAIIENNLFEGLGGPAIAVELALEDWYESINTNNILIKNNRFSRTSQSVAKSNDLVYFYQRDRLGNPVNLIDNVILSGNTLNDPNPDTIPPQVLSITRRDANPTSAAAVSFLVTMSEAVTGVTIGDFSIDSTGVSGASIISISGSGTTYVVNVNTGTVDGTLSIDFVLSPTSSIVDSAGNAPVASFTRGDAYTVSKSTSSAPDVELVYLNKTTKRLSPSVEMQLELINRDGTRLNYKGMEIRYYFDADGLTPLFTVLSANAPASAYRIRHDAAGKYVAILFVSDYYVAANGEFKIRFRISNSSQRNFDQSNDASFDATYTVKGPSSKIHVFLNGQQIWGSTTPLPIAPTVLSILRVGSQVTGDSQVAFLVTFSEPVTGVDLGDFAVDATGIQSPSLLSVSGSGTTYTLTASTGTSEGTLSVDFLANRSQGVTNSQGVVSRDDFLTGETYTITRPVTMSAPTIDSISTDTGTPNDFETTDTTLQVSGTWDLLRAITLSVAVNSVTYTLGVQPELTTDRSGRWTLDLTALPLPRGIYPVIVTSIDSTSAASQVSRIVRIVDEAPLPTAQLRYLNKSPQLTTPRVEMQLELYNLSATRLNYKNMEIRYYFDADGLTPQFNLLSVNTASSNLTFQYNAAGKYVSIAVVNDYFVDAGERLKLRYAITNREARSFSQANDPSFDASFTTSAPSTAIDVFASGVQIW